MLRPPLAPCRAPYAWFQQHRRRTHSQSYTQAGRQGGLSLPQGKRRPAAVGQQLIGRSPSACAASPTSLPAATHPLLICAPRLLPLSPSVVLQGAELARMGIRFPPTPPEQLARMVMVGGVTPSAKAEEVRGAASASASAAASAAGDRLVMMWL